MLDLKFQMWMILMVLSQLVNLNQSTTLKKAAKLYKNPKKMPEIFYNMFTANSKIIVNFLSNKSNIIEDINIVLKMPKMIFIKEII